MRKKLVFLGGVVLASAASHYGFAHIYGAFYGVHFRGAKVDFGNPPPRFTNPGVNDLDGGWQKPDTWRPGSLQAGESYAREDDVEIDARRRICQQKLSEALHAEAKGRYSEAVRVYREMNRKGLGPQDFIYRRIRLLSSDFAKPNYPGLASFLSSTVPVGVGRRPMPTLNAGPALEPFIDYEAASSALDSGQFSGARLRYAEFSHHYPASPLAEGAEIMAIRCDLMQDRPDAVSTLRGRDAAVRMLARCPKTRFRFELLGLVARADYLQKKFVSAEALYRRQLSLAASREHSLSAINSLILCGINTNDHELLAECRLRWFGLARTEDDAQLCLNNFESDMTSMSQKERKIFATKLKSDGGLASPYLQLRLELTKTTHQERADLIEIAAACLTRSDSVDRGRLLSLYAHLQYADNDLAGAWVTAGMAVRSASHDGDDWARAKFLKGSICKSKGDDSGAIRQYRGLIEDAPKSYIALSAREALAYLYDKRGELGLALDEFYSLNSSLSTNQDGEPDDVLRNYGADIGYLIDAKMTPSQLKSYIQRHARSPLRDVWVYSLGLRYLRKEQFRQAKQLFSSLSSDERRKLSHAWNNYEFDGNDPLQDPLQTANDLCQLRYEASVASSPEAKASALYRVATYYYIRRDLLLYNAPIWRGTRVNSFEFSWNRSTETVADKSALKGHQYEHECTMHAYQIFRDVATRFPKTSVAPKALYCAACALERCSHLSEWWREESSASHGLTRAADLMKAVLKLYPGSSLAEASEKYGEVYGDEASRTETDSLWQSGDQEGRPTSNPSESK
jgi:hypothetical protein